MSACPSLRLSRTELLSRETDETVNDAGADGAPEPEDFSSKVKTFDSAGWKEILDSADGQSTMVVIDLATEFFNARNAPLIDAVENLISPRRRGQPVRAD